MYAIQTEFVGKTEKKPAKIVAKCGISKVSVPVDETRDVWHSHAAAVVKICRELGKPVNYRGGMFGAGCMYWVAPCSSLRVEEPAEPAPVEAPTPIQATPVAAEPESAPSEAPAALAEPAAEPAKPARVRRAA